MGDHTLQGILRCASRCLLGCAVMASVGCGGESSEPSSLRVMGNRVVDAAGAPVVLRGLALADPQRLSLDGHWDAEYLRQARSWGAEVVRIPIHPRYYRDLGPDAYLALLDQGVEWSVRQGMYVVLDWHSIGDLHAGVFQPHPEDLYPTTIAETLDFWRRVAVRYRDEPRVAFYEIFNEPTQYPLGRAAGPTGTTWSQWRGTIDQIVSEIRAQSPKALVIAAGFDWAYDLRPVIADPVRHQNVVYAVHPYPYKRRIEPWEDYWQYDFGAFAGQYPVFATELGFETAEQARGSGWFGAVATVEYGERLLRFFDERGISWVAWCFHTTWTPALLEDWRYTPTQPAGELFRDALLRE